MLVAVSQNMYVAVIIAPFCDQLPQFAMGGLVSKEPFITTIPSAKLVSYLVGGEHNGIMNADIVSKYSFQHSKKLIISTKLYMQLKKYKKAR